MLAPAAMTDTEHIMFDAIVNEFYRNTDDRLATLGYTGSLREPYDKKKDTTKNKLERALINELFNEMPRPVSVVLIPFGDRGCRFFIDASRYIGDDDAKWLIDLSSNPNTRMKDLTSLAKRFADRSAFVTFKDISSPVDVLKAFGIDTTGTDLNGSEEDIEVDIDNPLSQDFPPPADII